MMIVVFTIFTIFYLVNIKIGKIRQSNIKNRTYYFYNDQINLKDFDARLSRVGKKTTKTLTFIILVM